MKLLPRKTFTIRLANSMLPLVQPITADIVRLAEDVKQTRQRLEYLTDGNSTSRSNDIYKKELRSIEKVTDQKSQTVEDCIVELRDLGLNTDSVIEGFVDFPAERKNEKVCLCWKLGEREVKHWHNLSEDCSLRRPVDLEMIRLSGELSLI